MPIDSTSSEEDVIQAMHEMTHQKVQAGEKEGSILMNEKNVSKLIAILEQSNFKNKDGMMEIASKWKDKNFDKIDEDHNYFWKLQDGIKGRSQWKLTVEEEQTFILQNYGEKALKEFQRENNISKKKQTIAIAKEDII